MLWRGHLGIRFAFGGLHVSEVSILRRRMFCGTLVEGGMELQREYCTGLNGLLVQDTFCSLSSLTEFYECIVQDVFGCVRNLI